MGVIQDDGDQTSMALDVPAKKGQETICKSYNRDQTAAC